MARKVFVGLSGGVDSAVSAALLKRSGLDVVGAFIKIWRPEFIACTWKEDRLDAMRVCASLSIPFREIDLSEEYKQEVVDKMVDAYAHGITPNPDVLCNRAIKFGAFLKWARAEGAERIATGHYAQVQQQGVHLELLRGRDIEKDQSYFLYRLSQQDLARVLFPVGALLKAQVRAAARKFDLSVAEKRDSQGLCFVGDVSIPEFLSHYIKLEEGPVLDLAGRRIGTHPGAALFTIGQRHGFTLESVSDAADTAQQAQYVVSIDTERNSIAVSPRREDAAKKELRLQEVNWTYRFPSETEALSVQTRYRQKAVPAHLFGSRIVFAEPTIAPPGQSLVLYRGDVCLGGGVVEKGTHGEALSTASPLSGRALAGTMKR